ncbi:MAG TPA: hypothetical protein VKX35_08130 [Fermentimonas sp.]|nr:hypothetical protein [Fermentimonas sp.]
MDLEVETDPGIGLTWSWWNWGRKPVQAQVFLVISQRDENRFGSGC